MDEKLRNMTSIYITKMDEMLLLFWQCGRVVSDTWVGLQEAILKRMN